MNPPPEFRNSDSCLVRPTPTRTVDFGLLVLRWRQASGGARAAQCFPLAARDIGLLQLGAQFGVPARPPCRPHGGAHTRCVRTRRTCPGTDAHTRHSKLCTRSTYCERSRCHMLCGALQQEPAHGSCCPQGAGGTEGVSPLRGQCPTSGTLSLSAGGVWAGSNFGVSPLIERPRVEGREESFVPEAEKDFWRRRTQGQAE